MKKPVALLQWLGLACLLSVSSFVCAETAPYITTVDKISAGDTAWMLTSTALVLLMTIPGLALFYSGMVRKKNVLATTLQSFVICAMVTVVCAYSSHTDHSFLHRLTSLPIHIDHTASYIDQS
jgi:predicted MFS family arabinose efflux permease